MEISLSRVVEIGEVEVLLPEHELISVEIGVQGHLSTPCGGSSVVLFEFVIAVLTSNLVMRDAGVEMLQSNFFGDYARQLHRQPL
jgi:hypothetical protein